MWVSGQRYDPAALCSRERTPLTHWIRGWVGLSSSLDTEAGEKILGSYRGSNPDPPVVQSVVRHYTDCPDSLSIGI
jgi:hypothetical protein